MATNDDSSYYSNLKIEFVFEYPPNPRIAHLLNTKISRKLTDVSNLFQEENSKVTLVSGAWKLLQNRIRDEIHNITKKHNTKTTPDVIQAKLKEAEYWPIGSTYTSQLTDDNHFMKALDANRKEGTCKGLFSIKISVRYWWVPKRWDPYNWKDVQENIYLEVEWLTFEGIDPVEDSVFEDECREESAWSIPAFDEESGECGEYLLTFKLVHRTSSKCKALISMSTHCWPEGNEATLMHFNELSQHLADLCYDLWKASGRPLRKYDPMTIEFGESRYSTLSVLRLLKQGLHVNPTNIEYHENLEHVIIVEGVHSLTSHTMSLFEELVERICCLYNAAILIHETDFEKLGFDETSLKRLDFIHIGKSDWFVRISNLARDETRFRPSEDSLGKRKYEDRAAPDDGNR